MTSLKVPPSACRFFHFLLPQPRSHFIVPYEIPTERNRGDFLRLSCSSSTPPQVVTKRKRTRYRKPYPGENVGITEEMRFVAMRLRNANGKMREPLDETESAIEEEAERIENGSSQTNEEETWKPNIEGFLNYLVDSKLVFDTIERIVDESDDVTYAYFRKTGLQRSERLGRDLEWFRQKALVIPQPSNPGVSYSNYLKEQAEKSAPLFLSHFYNIYFSYMTGGQAIVKQVSEKLLEGKELEFNRWEGEAELLKGIRVNLNMLAENWSRDEKNKCLKETAKAFKFMGQIVRLIIL